jgi:cellobiose phosphorylase
MKSGNQIQQWRFLNSDGDFRLENPQLHYGLYFPLANEAGMVSAVTPSLYGDIKTGQNTFLTLPVSVEDLHNTRSNRNFWLYIQDHGAWSVTGNSAPQIARTFTANAEKTTVEAGFLWHKVIRENHELGVRATLSNFVPANEDTVELMRVTIANTGGQELIFTPTAAIPIFGRSAANIRDHRHVTSLLHRIVTTRYGVRVCPTFCFDERGHQVNHVAYGVMGADGEGRAPLGFFPILEEFIGAGGSLEWPAAAVNNMDHWVKSGASADGYEALGGLRFQETFLKPGQSVSYIIVMVIAESTLNLDQYIEKYGSEAKWDYFWRENTEYWRCQLDRLSFHSGAADFDQWLKWVTLQPVLRKIYGCSFLPYHDYGKGGRGWRDLWQDCLALLLLNPADVRELLLNNFSGVRIDGSNATIIGSKPGQFIADRNNISRVWMDHGAWPFFTTKLYIERSGDFHFLLEAQTYFQDGQIFRSKRYDDSWDPKDGTMLRQRNGAIYHGSVLEHILVQLVSQFFNVGVNNHIRLEGADWNDALDMAAENGESVAFTAFYAFNLAELSKMLDSLAKVTPAKEVELAAELVMLLDTLGQRIDYNLAKSKQELLQRYFDACKSRLSGNKIKVQITDLVNDLAIKAEWLASHIRASEWIGDGADHFWYNSYYNNDGKRVEGKSASGIRMMLTGQVFTIMAGVASHDQTISIINAVNCYLKDPQSGGIRLNTDFGGIQPNLGRGFAFAYGHKENGAIFSHMAVMYAYALYQRSFVREGYRVLQSLYNLSADFEKSLIYPGIPEYFDIKGRGAYPYLTGAASWLLFVYLTEVYGIQGDLGNLALEPKLLLEQFKDSEQLSITTVFLGLKLTIAYINRNRLEYGSYRIQGIRLDGKPAAYHLTENRAVISKELIMGLDPGHHHLEVDLE